MGGSDKCTWRVIGDGSAPGERKSSIERWKGAMPSAKRDRLDILPKGGGDNDEMGPWCAGTEGKPPV